MHKTLIASLAAVLLLVGCAPARDPSELTPDQQMAQTQAWIDNNNKSMNDKVAALEASGKPPVDYRSAVEQYFEENLKDPDSRKVTYGPAPTTGAVCGKVNAKNTYGGYTGAEPFLAYFDAAGKIAKFEIIDADSLGVIAAAQSGKDVGYAERLSLQRCGIM
jgi:hypothetical protein